MEGNGIKNEIVVEEEKFRKCPYCGGKMRLELNDLRDPDDRGRLRRYFPPMQIYYECYECDSRSPKINLYKELLDEKKVMEDISVLVETIIKDRKAAMEEDIDYD